jgi:methyltransferase (TIGR00027 family)
MKGPSGTAVLTAVARALHREEPPPWVLDDFLALDLAGEIGGQVRARLTADVGPDALLAFSRWVCVRARVPEDIVQGALGEGCRQYVILGAGLDSFAYRRRDLVDRLRVFEVDHPETQAWKRSRLAEIGVDLPDGLVFAPVDFERETLADGLVAAGFDFGAPAVFSWIGVTMYLTLDAITATLTTVRRSCAGSRVVLTYNLPAGALEGNASATQDALARIAAELGEPFVSLFLPEEIEGLMRDIGFDHIVHVGPKEARATYFSGRSDVTLHGAQRLIAATVPPP